MSYSLNISTDTVGEDRPLFCVVVSERASDLPAYARGSEEGGRAGVAIDDAEAREMALTALDVVWQDL